MKKFVAMLLAGALLIPGLASAEKTKVRWFVGLGTGTNEQQLAPQEAVVKKFNESQNDIELSIEIVANAQAFDVLATQIAAGNAPDLVGPVGLRGRDSFKGAWLDLQPLVDKTKYDLSDFQKEMVDFYRVEGEGLLGLPFGIYPSYMFVNKTAFEEAGLPLPPQEYGKPYVDKDGKEKEWNFDTVKELAIELTVDKNGNAASDASFDPENIAQYGFGIQWTDARGVGTFFGPGSFVAADGKTAQIPAEWVEAWKWVYDGMWTSHFYPTNAGGNSDYMGQGNWFQTGNIAMDLIHQWYAGCCMAEFKDEWDTAVVPSFNGKTTAKMHADSFMISKTTKNADATFAVLQYLLGEASDELLQTYGAMPARISKQDAYFEKFAADKFPGKTINWQVVKDSAKYADNPNHESWMPSFQEANNKYNEFFTKLGNEAGLDVAKEAETLKGDLQKIFDAAKK
ncbi:sugar ABC transporter substrate-binding protein [Candidatus Moduliflexus flocculans]|uniref:Sugar ABC transporter substrate-binding protein n=1 Tax=Candidatus Moduliflexus flocculans TaxID=1499966 RepID=A0A0S6VVN1_9BACT|nr:sugar ABC transporter substrate-binding protein [Candidatus Moduliflexus flocculans]